MSSYSDVVLVYKDKVADEIRPLVHDMIEPEGAWTFLNKGDEHLVSWKQIRWYPDLYDCIDKLTDFVDTHSDDCTILRVGEVEGDIERFGSLYPDNFELYTNTELVFGEI